MTAKNYTENSEQLKIKDDISSEEVNMDKLAALRAKMKKEENIMTSKIIAKKERSIEFGVIGTGQAGSRLAEAWYKLGYEAIAINTASQDLKFIEMPEANKLLLQYAELQGAAKELSIGHAAAEANVDAIRELVVTKLDKSQVNILCLSLGGGSGAGSCEVMLSILQSLGKPVMVIACLPMDTDDAQTKNNALQTLAKLAEAAQKKQIANLITVDNARIEAIYSDVSQMEFFKVANDAIVTPLDILNTLSSMPSAVKSVDSMECAKLLTDGEGLTVYGEMTVEDFSQETSIAEAVISNLDSNLLAKGFNLKEARYVGVLVVANKAVWKKIPSVSVNYALAMVNELCESPKGVFKGVYEVEMPEDVVKVYSYFSGLGLPVSRVEQIKKEAQSAMQTVKDKDQKRNLSLTLDTGVDKTVSDVQKIKDKIAQKSSAFGKFLGNNDRRK